MHRAEEGSPRQQGVTSARRYYLLKAQVAEARFDMGLAAVWRGKHDAAPGRALDASFPSFAELTASMNQNGDPNNLHGNARYSTVEDLVGATPDELVQFTGINFSAAREVFKALAVLLQQT